MTQQRTITDQFTYEHRCENTKFSFKLNTTTHQKRSPIVGFILEVPGEFDLYRQMNVSIIKKYLKNLIKYKKKSLRKSNTLL